MSRTAILIARAMAVALLSTAAMAQIPTPNEPDSDVFASTREALSDAADRSLATALSQQSWMKGSEAPTGKHGNQAASSTPVRRVQAAIERVNRLRPTIEPILRQEGVPTQLSAVVLVESGGLAAALSPKGARGVWQFMPDTARRYGLVVQGLRDERVDVEKSTHAAARYLRDLYIEFGDWSLALAAYNAGEPTLQGALERSGTREFAAISVKGLLPLETRNYVPAVLAAMNTLHRHDTLTLTQRENSARRVVYASSGSE